MSDRITFTDRLRDRGFIDQWGFMGFALTGFVAIFVAKYLNVPTVGISMGALLLMFAYALVIGRAGTGRVRADQAGDNCYYLGLIYTLASLSYAIANFDPNDTASTIVQGFGIALASTIFGLILRVFFNQGRPDLENVEEQTRLELTEAASRLKGELNGVVMQLNDFSRRLQQSMQEMQEAATTSMEGFTKSSVDGLKEVVMTANEAIRSEANDFAARSKRYSTTFDELIGKLEAHGESLGQVTESHSALNSAALKAKKTAESVATSVEALVGATDAARSAAESAEDASQSAAHVAEKLSASVEKIEIGFQSIRDETDRQLGAIKDGPVEASRVAIDALAEAGRDLERHLVQIANLHAGLQTNLSSQVESASEASKRHNDALEAELTRSREMVGKVHGALVEMTGSLVQKVEQAG